MKLPLAALAVAAAVAPLSAHAADQCFRSSQIRNHTIVDKSTTLIDVDGRQVFRITTNGACFAGATSSDPLIMRSPPGSTYICKPIDLDLGVKIGGGPAVHCIVSSIHELSPAEVAALPKKLRP